jgi:5-methylcytosine-specific restriction endonuclease McrA
MRKRKRLIKRRGSSQLICPVCDRPFIRSNASIEKKDHCCSYKCAHILRKKKPIKRWGVTLKCKCGKSFYVPQHRRQTAKYCSLQCARIYGAPRGESHSNWKGGASERTWSSSRIVKAKVKQIGKCERCNSTDNLQGHHKLSYADHPEFRCDPNNIEVLCTDCHAKEHPELANMIQIPRIRSGITINCAVCGIERYIPQHLIGSAKYCSKACQRKALHESLRGRSRSSRMMMAAEPGP